MYNFSVRPLSHSEIPEIVNYWTLAPADYLLGMGVDLSKVPSAEQLFGALSRQLTLSVQERTSYCIIWLCDERPIGHCNLNPFVYGNSGSLHLHIWRAEDRHHGYAAKFLPLSIEHFFSFLQLQQIVSEPFAENGPPHRALEKCGFVLEKEYRTVPGSLGSEQLVKRWVLWRTHL